MTQIFIFIMHNIGYAALGMALGIVTAQLDIAFFGIVSVVLAAPLAIQAIKSRHHPLIMCAVTIIAWISGGFLYQQQMETFKNRSAFYQNNTIDVIATVNDSSPGIKRTCIWLTVHKTRCNKRQPWQPAHDFIMLCIKKTPDIDTSDIVQIDSLICSKNNSQPWSKQGLVGTAFFARNITRLYHPWLSITRWLAHKRHELWQTLQTKLSPPAFHLFSTIFLGKNINDDIQEDLRSYFVHWGLAHYLARSGIHLIMILLLLNTLLRLLFIPYRLRAIMVALFCTLYAALSWPSIPFIRAFFAIIVYQLCHILKVPINSLHILHLTLLYCLITNPMALFFLDFQLTFALTYILIIAMRKH